MVKESMINILLIEDEEFDVRRVKNTVNFYETKIKILDIVSNGKAALELIRSKPDKYDIVILDYQISGGLKGEELIKQIKELDRFIQIIVITKMTINITDYNFANNLLKAGAFWYCTKYPGNIEDYIYQPTDFTLSIFNAYEKKRLEKHNIRSDKKLKQNIENILESKKIIGESKPIIQLKENIEKYAKSDVNILISGASGTGKELVAWNMHLKSKRRYENFIPINCGSIPGELIESELFGYVKGAHSTAFSDRKGRLEEADKGTLFIDEVGDLPDYAQVKLLRCLETRTFERLGENSTKKVDVRFVAATNINLEEAVKSGKFREDLYYRLKVLEIHLPPLRERIEDIPYLVYHFMDKFNKENNLNITNIVPEAMEQLQKYHWPGNIRELENKIEQAIVMADGDTLYPRHFSSEIQKIHINGTINDRSSNKDVIQMEVGSSLREMEKELIVRTLNKVAGNKTKAAEILGIGTRTLYRKIEEYNIG